MKEYHHSREYDGMKSIWERGEISFIAEYRISSACFNLFHEILEQAIIVNKEKALVSVVGNDLIWLISTSSILAVTMILLGGGRYFEAMRTRGIAKSAVYLYYLSSSDKSINF